MYLESGVLREPEFDPLLLMSCIVVHDDMNIQFGGHVGIDVA